jgi:hypothetical protein
MIGTLTNYNHDGHNVVSPAEKNGQVVYQADRVEPSVGQVPAEYLTTEHKKMRAH